MNYRRLGRTGLEISEIGYGAWGIGKSMGDGRGLPAETVERLHAHRWDRNFYA